MNFEFIADLRFRTLLSRDYVELRKCLDIDAHKSALVLAGSILEAALSDFFIQFPLVGKSEQTILQSSLGELIDLAESENVISNKEKNLASVIKGYRNLIHPGKEIRKGEQIDKESAEIAANVVDLILRSIKSVYLTKYGHSAKQIFDRLKKDWHYQSVFGQVIVKLNQTEKAKLLELLVYFDMWEKSHWEAFNNGVRKSKNETYDLEDHIKPLVEQLKPLIPNYLIKTYLNQLVKEIETGTSDKAYCLYNLFHENIHELEGDERELIVIYMLDFALSLLDNTSLVAYEKTYSTIGKHINSVKTKNALKKFIDDYVVNCYGETIEEDVDIFEQIINGLSEELKTEMLQYLTNYLPNKENIGRDLFEFYVEVEKRGLILEKEN